MGGDLGHLGPDVALVSVRFHADPRGTLTAVELTDLPFTVRRVFAIADVPAGACRGGHRHRRGVQALFCTSGRVQVELRGATGTGCLTLEPDGVGVQIPAGVWSSQRYLTAGSSLLVLASEPYDPTSYDPEVPR